MKFYKLRVDLFDVTDYDIINLVDDYCETYCYCVEGGDDNPHMHFYLEFSNSPESIRKKLRELGLKGNSSYSLKELDEKTPLEYIAYLMKEGKFVNVGVDDVILQSAKDYDKKIKDEIKQKKQNKQKTIDKVTEYVKERIRKDYIWGDVAHLVVQYHLENKLMVRTFIIKSYTDTIHLRLNENVNQAIDAYLLMEFDRYALRNNFSKN